MKVGVERMNRKCPACLEDVHSKIVQATFDLRNDVIEECRKATHTNIKLIKMIKDGAYTLIRTVNIIQLRPNEFVWVEHGNNVNTIKGRGIFLDMMYCLCTNSIMCENMRIEVK